MALVMPFLFLVLLAILEFGLLIFSYNAVSNVAREGARYGVAHPTDLVGINNTARAIAAGLQPARLQVIITKPTFNTIRVEAAYDYSILTGYIVGATGGLTTMHLRSVSTMQIEQ